MRDQHLKGYLQREQLLDIISFLTKVVQQGLDLASIMHMVTVETTRLTHSDGAVIEVAEGSDMVYKAASGLAENQLNFRLAISNSLSGFSVQTGRTLVCLDSERDERVNLQACRAIGLRSMIVHPLKNKNQNVGVLKVLYKAPNAFGNKEIEIVRLMSDVVAALMSTAIEYGMDELYKKATTDQLTGIPNRALFFDRLKRHIIESNRTGDKFCIAIFDMDGLKPINDNLGHRVGDVAIREVAERAKKSIRECDTISRLGGDEFGIILYKTKSLGDAENLCNRIRSLMNKEFSFENKNIPLSISIGCAVFSEDGGSIDELVETADLRMYKQKSEKKNTP